MVKPKNALPVQGWRILDVETNGGDMISTEFCDGLQCAVSSACGTGLNGKA